MCLGAFGAYDTLIFDIGNVLFTWNEDSEVQHGNNVNLTSMINTQTWYDYEIGEISDTDVYPILAAELGVDKFDIEDAIARAVDSLRPRIDMFQSINLLKPGRKIYAMSNMSVSIWNIVKSRGGDYWDVFDQVFISGTVGARKPELSFYRHVMAETGATPGRTIFVDDTRENLVTACSLGLKTILYDNDSNVERLLHNLCWDPVTRANQFLATNAKNHLSYILDSGGKVIHENFCQLLILEATNDSSLVDFTTYEAECNFFKGSAEFTTSHYPNDLDTTSVAWTVSPNLVDSSTRKDVMDRMLTFCDRDGIPLTYFDRNRPRRDHVICVNIITLFHAHGRGNELQNAVSWISSVLRTGAYMEGSRYYMGAEPFLYFVLRLLERAPLLEEQWRYIYKEKCQEQVGSSGDALALAMRLHCCTRVGINNIIDLQRLLDMQQRDGGWEGGCFYRYGMTNRRIVGNRGLATAIAQRAIKEYRSKFSDCGLQYVADRPSIVK